MSHWISLIKTSTQKVKLREIFFEKLSWAHRLIVLSLISLLISASSIRLNHRIWPTYCEKLKIGGHWQDDLSLLGPLGP